MSFRSGGPVWSSEPPRGRAVSSRRSQRAQECQGSPISSRSQGRNADDGWNQLPPIERWRRVTPPSGCSPGSRPGRSPADASRRAVVRDQPQCLRGGIKSINAAGASAARAEIALDARSTNMELPSKGRSPSQGGLAPTVQPVDRAGRIRDGLGRETRTLDS